jgi:hypothetical protein
MPTMWSQPDAKLPPLAAADFNVAGSLRPEGRYRAGVAKLI